MSRAVGSGGWVAIAGAGEEGELVRVRVEFSWYLYG